MKNEWVPACFLWAPDRDQYHVSKSTLGFYLSGRIHIE